MRTTPSAAVFGGPCSPSAWYSSWQFGLRSTSLPAARCPSPVQMVGIVLSYVIILGDFIYDFARIRPLRNMYRAQAEGMSENKLNALIERAGCRGGQEGLQEEVAFVSILIAKI